MQDSVAIRAITEMLSLQEKLGHDTNLKKKLSSTVMIEIQGRTWKLRSRHQLAEAALKRCCDMGINVAT